MALRFRLSVQLAALLAAILLGVVASTLRAEAPDHPAGANLLGEVASTLRAGAPAGAINESCDTARHYFVGSCYGSFRTAAFQDWGAAVAMFSDTAADVPQFSIATTQQVGTIWGLGYRANEDAVYASAFHKRQLPFGPLGPGGVYRIDLSTGDVTGFLTVPDAGSDEHTLGKNSRDRTGAEWAGKTSLGDLDFSEDGADLFVVNLFNRRIYRFAMPSGELLSSWEHGAAAETWALDARPFALAVRDGSIYHAVTNSAESTGDAETLEARVYRSAFDGQDMKLVATVDLSYRRGLIGDYTTGQKSLDWLSWRVSAAPPDRTSTVLIRPMPLVADIEFDADDNMLLGLRDRSEDLSVVHLISTEGRGGYGGGDPRDIPSLGIGDVLLGAPSGDGWVFETSPAAHFEKDSALSDRAGYGGLAFDRMMGTLISGAMRDASAGNGLFSLSPGALWFRTSSGRLQGEERVCESADRDSRLAPYQPDAPGFRAGAGQPAADDRGALPMGGVKIGRPGANAGPGSVGDIESLCAPLIAPTATEPIPTKTSTPTEVPTKIPTDEPTATSAPSPIFLPVLVYDAPCVKTQQFDVMLVMDASSSMLEPTRSGRTKLAAAIEAAGALLDLTGPGDRAAVVAFNSGAKVVHPLTQSMVDVRASLNQIEVQSLTRIHLGIRVAHEHIAANRAAGREEVMVVLTDGRSNPEPVLMAEQEADAAKAAGVRVFTVGLGADVETDALTRMASDPADYFSAPDGEELRGIYERIARELPCPKESFWPGR